LIEVGVDEAGRGCLAGPVCAAAVILNPSEPVNGLNDSKQLHALKREELEGEIRKKALSYAVAYCDNHEIDEFNILKASIYAMHRALDKIESNFDHILVDGNKFLDYNSIPFKTIVKGDSKYQSIAAASILAKCARDRIMVDLHEEFNYYDWKRNKGYPTINHRRAIEKYGACQYHRKSFKLLPDKQLNIF
jgi:ribonuclease HII